MKLVVGPAYVQVEVDHWMERTALTELLTVTHGRRGQEEEYCYLTDEGQFATGLLEHVLLKLKERQLAVEVEGEPEPDLHDYEITPDYLEGVELRDYQLDAIEKALAKRRGIVKIATGGGKTEVQAAVAKALGDTHGVRTLTVVTGIKGANQTYRRFLKRGLSDVGRLSGAHHDIVAQHVVATVQTLYAAFKRRHDDVMALLKEAGLIQFDECHHEGADSWYLPGMRVETGRRLSYSATPFHEDPANLHPYDARVLGMTGPVIINASSKYLRDRGFLVDPKIFMVKIDQPKDLWRRMRSPYHTIERDGIVQNQVRNTTAINIARTQHERHRVAFLVRRIEHGKHILTKLAEHGISAKFCSRFLHRRQDFFLL